MLEWAERAAVTARSTTSETVAMNNDDRSGVLSRFWLKVNKGGPVHPTLGTACWLWTASLNSDGYGNFRFAGVSAKAHRIAYEMCVGPIPDGLELDHLCRIPSCVNPAHLDPVTHVENCRRGLAGKHGYHLRKTHCPRGHAYAGENLYARNGQRDCRECIRRRGRKRRALQREAIDAGRSVVVVTRAAITARKEV